MKLHFLDNLFDFFFLSLFKDCLFFLLLLWSCFCNNAYRWTNLFSLFFLFQIPCYSSIRKYRSLPRLGAEVELPWIHRVFAAVARLQPAWTKPRRAGSVGAGGESWILSLPVSAMPSVWVTSGAFLTCATRVVEVGVLLLWCKSVSPIAKKV